MAIPVGQYVKRENTASGFSSFNVGDTLIVRESASNNGIYTINSITNDGTHSYMGLTGPPLVEENQDGTDTSIQLSGIGKSGDKLIALGDEDAGTINVWSYNSSTDDDDAGSNSGTIYESGTIGVSVGTSGWTANAISPVLKGSTSQFIFTPGQSALRVCDANDLNTSIIKHFKFYETRQFGSSGSQASTYSRGSFTGWQEHSNFLAKPSSGWFLGGGGNTHAENQDRPQPGNSNAAPESKCWGFSFLNAYGFSNSRGQRLSIDTHLIRSLNLIEDSYGEGSYSTRITKRTMLKTSEAKNPSSSQTYLKMGEGSLSRVPTGAVIGLANESGRVDQGVTFTSERMLVRNVEIENQRLYVYRGYGSSTPAEIDIDVYPYIVQYGCGWNFTVAWGNSGSGSYMPGEYEFATSFVYDGDQESLLRTNEDLQADNTLRTFIIPDSREFCELVVSVMACGPYPARVTGGRIYIREKEADDDWHLLTDIDLVKGVRSSLTGKYTIWWHWAANHGNNVDAESGSTIEEWTNVSDVGQVPKDCFSSRLPIRSKNPSIETYNAINNYYPDIRRTSIGFVGESYKCSTIGGERAWYGNVKLRESSATVNRYGDRVMYSEFRRFDTIPGFNYINASEGDADDIVELKYFTDKLFIFKSNSLHIWNVKHAEANNWFPEQTIRKTGGIGHPCSAVSTSYGVVWANLHGCWYHDGRKVVNLTEGKLKDTEQDYHNLSSSWATFVKAQDEKVKPMLMFSPKEKQLYILRDPTGTSSGNTNRCYIYNFISQSWVYNDSIFTNERAYTNSILDWNNNIVLAYEASFDTGFNLGSNFTDNDTDIISSADDIRFQGGSCNWAVQGGGTFNFDTGNDRLSHSHNANTNQEGMKLPDANIDATIIGVVYRLELNLWRGGDHDEDLHDTSFFVSFAGTTVELGPITIVETKYTLDIQASSTGADLTITHGTNNSQTWYLGAASAKQITMDLDADADTKIVPGDRLKIDSEEFFVLGTNTDTQKDKITAEPGYNSTTKASHSSGADVYSTKAVFQQISPTSVSTSKPMFVTKDFDFDEPDRVKKIYKIYVTYMNSNSSSLSPSISVAADGNKTFANSSIATPQSSITYDLSGLFQGSSTSGSNWNVVVFSFDNPFPCQSISLKMNAGNSANGISINDITFEYRTINKRVS